MKSLRDRAVKIVCVGLALACIPAVALALAPSSRLQELAVAPVEEARVRRQVSVSVQVADIKFDGQVKITELGLGMRAGYAGYDALNPDEPMFGRIWTHIQEEIGLPIWFLAEAGRFADQDFRAQLQLEKLLAHEGSWAADWFALSHALLQGTFGQPRRDFDPTDITTYAGIVVNWSQIDTESVVFRNLLARNPQILVLDPGSLPELVGHKLASATFFDGPLAESRPQWQAWPRRHQDGMARSIRNQMPAKRYVIKPVAESQGRGILPVAAIHLDTVLPALLAGHPPKHSPSAYVPEEIFEYWRNAQGRFFLIETYEESKPVKHAGRQYDGTMRVVYVLRQEEDHVEIAFLGGYWKLPPTPVGEGSLTERTISRLDTDRVAPVAPEDWATVTAQLREILPDVYRQMRSMGPYASMSEKLNDLAGEYVQWQPKPGIGLLHKPALAKVRALETWLERGQITAADLLTHCRVLYRPGPQEPSGVVHERQMEILRVLGKRGLLMAGRWIIEAADWETLKALKYLLDDIRAVAKTGKNRSIASFLQGMDLMGHLRFLEFATHAEYEPLVKASVRLLEAGAGPSLDSHRSFERLLAKLNGHLTDDERDFAVRAVRIRRAVQDHSGDFTLQSNLMGLPDTAGAVEASL